MHHAYLLLGSEKSAEAQLEALLSASQIPTRGNPDFYRYDGESFDVEDARDLNRRAQGKAFGRQRTFVLAVSHLTMAAQNALLKTLEDAGPDTTFFILGREEKLFLPTLISRLQIRRSPEAEALSVTEAVNFLKAAPTARLDWVKKFVERDDRTLLAPFLDSLLVELKKKNTSYELLKKVFVLREFATDPAVMSRLILEHLALLV